MLEKAVVLPDKLAKSRSLYIKHVQALRLMQEKSRWRRTARQKNAADRDGQEEETAAPADKAADTGYVHHGLKSITHSASVKYAVEHQYIENHGQEVRLRRQGLVARAKARARCAPADQAWQRPSGCFGPELPLGAEDRISSGRRAPSSIENEGPRAPAEQRPRHHRRQIGHRRRRALVRVPLPENLWLALGGEFNFIYPDFERGQRFGYRKGYTDLAASTRAYTPPR